jgi:hypothetical protein
MAQLVESGASQFIVATHSPILLTYPGADLVSFDEVPPRSVRLEETSHYQITRGILEAPELVKGAAAKGGEVWSAWLVVRYNAGGAGARGREDSVASDEGV